MTEAPLTGYRVVDLSVGVPGGYCTKILADAGAVVVKLEPPEGDPLRRWSASGAVIAPDDDGALFQYLAGSKRSVVADPESAEGLELARVVISDADAVVWSRGSRLGEHPELSPPRLRALAPHAPIVAITPFGLDGPWADRPAAELTLQAWCGGLGQRGSADRPPVAAGGDLVSWAAGLFAANGLLTARTRARDTGTGELLDVSMLESAILTQTMYQVTYRTIAGRPMRTMRAINFPGIEQTKDGWVGFMVVTGQQWFDFCVMVERPEWMTDELILFEHRIFRREELGPAISQWMLDRTTDEIVELGTALRVPVSPVGNGATVTGFDQFVERACYLANPRGGFLQPDVPYTLSNGAERRAPEPAPRLGAHTADERTAKARAMTPVKPATTAARLPFEGLRVADLTAFWAGPIVGHYLAMLGAEVIHIESTKRPDGMRFSAVQPMTEDRFWEWSPMYQGPNTNKLDLTLDLQSERGRELVRRLIATCDVVIDNYSPRVMEAWGLTYDKLTELRPDIIQVRAPAFGLSGPWRDRVGYAQTMEQASGMAWLTGYPDQEPQVPNGPCDPVGGTHTTIALQLALEHRHRTGKGMLVEVPQVGGALSIAAEQVIEHSAYDTLLERQGNRGPHASPQGVYRTADADAEGKQDRWIAIAVEDDAQWEALRDVLAYPEWAADPALATDAGRRAAADDLDRHLGAWCADRSVDDAVEELWDAGVPVAKVLMPHEQDEIPQLDARGFWEDVEHPVTGVNRHGGYPVRFSAGPERLHRVHAPLLGQDNRTILAGLGLTDAEIDALEAEGVIGTTLVMPS